MIDWFIHSLIHSFIHSLIHLLIHLFFSLAHLHFNSFVFEGVKLHSFSLPPANHSLLWLRGETAWEKQRWHLLILWYLMITSISLMYWGICEFIIYQYWNNPLSLSLSQEVLYEQDQTWEWIWFVWTWEAMGRVHCC